MEKECASRNLVAHQIVGADGNSRAVYLPSSKPTSLIKEEHDYLMSEIMRRESLISTHCEALRLLRISAQQYETALSLLKKGDYSVGE